MPRYNLAYYPSDQHFAAKCIAFAQEQFADAADGYLLNPNNALPHVTLSQFRTEETRLDLLWEQATSSGAMHNVITFEAFVRRPGNKEHEGYTWVELRALRSPGLVECQGEIIRILKAADIEPFTGTGAQYHPHLTLGRLKALPPSGLPLWPDEADLRQPHTFHLTLGLANDNGVFLQKIRPL